MGNSLAPLFTVENRRIIWVCMLGCALEFYDFMVFAIFAKTIAQLFFPTEAPGIALLSTFATFAIGYLARPLGGIFISHIGDRYGRKRPFTYAVLFMGLSTFLIGCLPTYAQVGFWAPVALILLRLIQGFSVGGEVPGAITYICEVLPKQRFLACGLILLGMNLGMEAGLLLHNLLTSKLLITDLNSWGWRIPFFIGGALGALGYYQRKMFFETPVFKAIQSQVVKLPLQHLWQHHRKQLFASIALGAAAATAFSMLFVIAITYLTTVLNFSNERVSSQISLWHGLFGVLLVFTALLLQLNNKKKQIIVALLILQLLTAVPIFYAFAYLNLLALPMAIGTLITAGIMAFAPMLAAGSFPAQHRYTGIALGYNLPVAIFGGLAPLLALLLIRVSGHPVIPGYMIALVAAVALLMVNRLFNSYQYLDQRE